MFYTNTRSPVNLNPIHADSSDSTYSLMEFRAMFLDLIGEAATRTR